MDETASKSKPKRSPLHIGGDQRNIIDVDSSETETTSSSSSSSNSDDSTTTSTSSTTSSTSSTTSDESSPAIMGEGENAPHIPSVMIIPRRGTPVFPVPELAQHLLIKDPDVVKKLEKQLITGTPYIGVFMRRGDSDIPKSSSEHDDGYEADDVIYDLDEIHNIGTLAQVAAIRQLGRFNSEDEIETDQTLDQETNSSKPKSAPIWHVMLTGHRRIRFDRNNIASTIKEQGPPMVIDIEHLSTPEYDPDDKILEATSQEMMNTIRDVLQTNEMLYGPVNDFLKRRIEVQDPPRLADFAASLTSAKPELLQELMETLDVQERLDRALLLLKTEVEKSKLRKEIKESVEQKIGETQRKYMLNEQLKEIKNELGLEKDDKASLLEKFRTRLAAEGIVIPEEAQKTIDEEMSKLESLEKNSPEFNTTRNYMDWLTSIPWGKKSDEQFDVKLASDILDEDHYGMKDVKERILETIAVGRLKGKVGQGKIICLSGPPGTGKTSIGKSIARALNREFFRFSVGGLSDVAEIKGHRRTYIGAMPGKVIQGLKKTGTFNPLVLIDEIDKLGRGYQGDPASALLELLDPSQNEAFVDHYLDTPVDMSQVLFICTANVLETIPGPLLDRMEIIQLSGYDTPEKIEITRRYLEPRAREDTGLIEGNENIPENVEITDGAISDLIRWYCREAGVRNLQKQVQKIYRTLALDVVRDLDGLEKKSNKNEEPSTSTNPYCVDEQRLKSILGKPPFTSDRLYEEGTPPGVVMGLAWTSMGGASLYIECSAHYEAASKRGTNNFSEGGVGVLDGFMSGGGNKKMKDQKSKESGNGNNSNMGGGGLYATGMMGDVMKESTLIAHTVARAKLHRWDSTNDYFQRAKIHMHIPEGATPKDGPSAGITMVTALVSLALDRPIRPDVAMTGEVSLTGKVLPVGGIKEKTIAAKRSGAQCLIFPEGCRSAVDELDDYLKDSMEIHFVEHYDDVFDIAFGEDRFFDL